MLSTITPQYQNKDIGNYADMYSDINVPTNDQCIENCVLDRNCNTSVYYKDSNGTPICAYRNIPELHFLPNLVDKAGYTTSRTIGGFQTAVMAIIERCIRSNIPLPVLAFDSALKVVGIYPVNSTTQFPVTGLGIKKFFIPPQKKISVVNSSGVSVEFTHALSTLTDNITSFQILDNPTSSGYLSMPTTEVKNMSPTLIKNKKPQKIDFTFVLPSLHINAILFVFTGLKYIYVSSPMLTTDPVTVGFTFSDTNLIDSSEGFVISSTNSSCPAPFTQQDCPVDCQILSDQWSDWSACDANGMRTRTKQYIPAINGGVACVPSDILETQYCPIDCKSDGNWSNWSCDPSTGMKSRISGAIPAQYGGRECSPSDTLQTAPCDPIDCSYSEWSDWFACDPITNTQSRVRSVISPDQYGGKACSISDEIDSVPCTPSCNYVYEERSQRCRSSVAKKMLIPIITPTIPSIPSIPPPSDSPTSPTPLAPLIPLAPLEPTVNGSPIESPDMSKHTFIAGASTASPSYSDIPDQTENACYTACANDSMCVTAEWNNKTSLCRLKADNKDLQTNSDANLMVKDMGAIFNSKSTSTEPYSDIPNQYEIQCYQACRDDPNCALAQWNKETSLCRLKADSKGIEENWGANIFIKKGSYVRPRQSEIYECGYERMPRGWYDFTKQGVRNDFCSSIGDFANPQFSCQFGNPAAFFQSDGKTPFDPNAPHDSFNPANYTCRWPTSSYQRDQNDSKESYEDEYERDTGKNYRDSQNRKRLIRNIIFGILCYALIMGILYLYFKK